MFLGQYFLGSGGYFLGLSLLQQESLYDYLFKFLGCEHGASVLLKSGGFLRAGSIVRDFWAFKGDLQQLT
jgi:hypothetical protein